MRYGGRAVIVAGALMVPLAAQEAKNAAEKPGAEPATVSVADLTKLYQKASQAFLQKYREAKTPEERRKLQTVEYVQLRNEFAEKFLQLAQRHRKSSEGLRALVWVFGNCSDKEILAKASEQVLADHLNDKEIIGILPSLGRGNHREMLDKLAEQSSSREVRGVALYVQAQGIKGRELTEANAKEVMPLYERIRKEFSDVELVYANGYRAGKLGELVDNDVFAFENLRVGKPAPDIEGEDGDGVKFKLSDYRGKVVMLDFWGDW